MGQRFPASQMLGLSHSRSMNSACPFQNSCTPELPLTPDKEANSLNRHSIRPTPHTPTRHTPHVPLSPVRPRFGRTFCRKDKRVPFGLVATPL